MRVWGDETVAYVRREENGSRGMRMRASMVCVGTATEVRVLKG